MFYKRRFQELRVEVELAIMLSGKGDWVIFSD